MPFVSSAMIGVSGIFFFKIFVLSTIVRIFMDFRIGWTLSLGYAFVFAGAAFLEGVEASGIALSTTFVILICQLMLEWLRETEETLMYWPIVVVGVAMLAFFPSDVFGFLGEADAAIVEYVASLS
ncbi:MAG: hypothetical protein ACFB20_11135 [Opitutales bacterium]